MYLSLQTRFIHCDAGTSITTQTFSGLPEADADKNINTSGTESMLNKSDSDLLRLLHCLPLWALRNDSFAQHSLLEEQIKRQIHEMIPVPPPGTQHYCVGYSYTGTGGGSIIHGSGWVAHCGFLGGSGSVGLIIVHCKSTVD